jgi:chromosomal replication initiation ATPase DnaA
MVTLISFSQVVSKKRAMGKLLKLRFMFTALCRKYLVFSFSQIAKLLGGKDHTTVVYYEKKHKEQLMDPEYAEQYNQIEKNVQDILEQKRKSEDGS